MRITQLKDSQQLWNLKPTTGLSDPLKLGMDAKVAQDLCMQYINGLSKLTRQFPANEHSQTIAGLLADLSHELVTMVGGNILEQHTIADAVQEYTTSLERNLNNPDWNDGRLTNLLRNMEKKIAATYHSDSQSLHAAFIQTHNMSPYQYYRDHQRG